MGDVILTIALSFEIAFAVYCMVTKSYQQKVRSFVRIGALVAFVLFTLVSVIQWSFRWYGLATLLLVWAVLGAWTLIGEKVEQDEYRNRRVVRRAIRGVLLVCVAIIPALVFPQHQSPRVTGTHPVATVNYTYTDKSRTETFTKTGESRKVNVEFWYPKDGGGKYPLVVF
jgi:hypothetical protein